MIIGYRTNDLEVNPIKGKSLTNLPKKNEQKD